MKKIKGIALIELISLMSSIAMVIIIASIIFAHTRIINTEAPVNIMINNAVNKSNLIITEQKEIKNDTSNTFERF